MTARRIAVLAQALAMTMLLPGPFLHGSAPVQAALQQAPEPDAASVAAAETTGRGIGCMAGTRRFRGPREPGDPPWPPGAKPAESPQPSLLPSAAPSAAAEPDVSAAPAPEAAPSATPEAGSAGTAFVQGEVSQDPDADIAPDVPSRTGRRARDLGYLRGIDVSHHNDDIDYAKVRKAGYDFVFIKATQDTEFVDPMFLTNWSRARAAGLAAGGYHFFDYSLDGRDQADHFVDRLELADAIGDALPPVVDVECWAPSGPSVHALSAARLRDFVARVYERTGRLPILYTSVFMWDEVIGGAETFADLPLWAACWGCDAPPSIASGWDEWVFWQTGIDRVRGVKRLDGNLFAGTLEDLQTLKLRPFALAGGAPATASQSVPLDLGGRDATHLRTSHDGETWSSWQPVRGAARASLPPGEGPRTLYVQLRYGRGRPSPVLSDSIWLDRSGPEVSPLTIRLRTGPIASGLPMEVSWQARDSAAGLGDATVSTTCAEQTTRTDVPASAAPGEAASLSAPVEVPPEARCVVEVVARDAVGNETSSRAIDVATSVSPGGEGQVSATVSGAQVGVLARRGPDGGRASIELEGQTPVLVDLYAPTPGEPEVVHVAELTSEGPVQVSVEPTGTADPASSGERVSIEGFVTLGG